jgi:hypothetical protein
MAAGSFGDDVRPVRIWTVEAAGTLTPSPKYRAHVCPRAGGGSMVEIQVKD